MGMRMSNIVMTTKVKKKDLLTKLRTNYEQHSKIVAEARVGYIEKAKLAVAAKLEELRSNRVVALQFNFSPPADYSEIYRTTIRMIEWNQQEEIELSADEFRQLVEDKWDWKSGFVASNQAYSATAQAMFGGLESHWDEE